MSELKPAENTAPEDVQPEINPESIDSQTQVVELETQLSKEMEEKENYRKATLAKEAENKRLKAQLAAINESPSEEEPEGEAPQSVEPVEPKVEEETPAPVDVPVEEKPKENVSAGYNPETEAKAQFKEKYPNTDMSKVLAEYRGGKYETVTEYLKALEDAKNYSDYLSKKVQPTNYVSQGNGVSEVENTSQPKVTAYAIKQAKKYFKGDVAAYLKNNKQ